MVLLCLNGFYVTTWIILPDFDNSWKMINRILSKNIRNKKKPCGIKPKQRQQLIISGNPTSQHCCYYRKIAKRL